MKFNVDLIVADSIPAAGLVGQSLQVLDAKLQNEASQSDSSCQVDTSR